MYGDRNTGARHICNASIARGTKAEREENHTRTKKHGWILRGATDILHVTLFRRLRNALWTGARAASWARH
jgi:hypothetical protein